jgi:hypothetical protein
VYEIAGAANPLISQGIPPSRHHSGWRRRDRAVLQTEAQSRESGVELNSAGLGRPGVKSKRNEVFRPHQAGFPGQRVGGRSDIGDTPRSTATNVKNLGKRGPHKGTTWASSRRGGPGQARTAGSCLRTLPFLYI